ncbi:hypothetical protein [Atopobacter phocae]|uniref:hypothetical protein n=1 Tax=Atopobacter phocae TaxID=136492 RepID=UPI0004706934|nr:hypothetical protein [Atopobacter phocae]
MKTSEFIKRVKELGYSLGETEHSYVVTLEGEIILQTSKESKYKMDVWFYDAEDGLFDLAVKYAKTPIEQRKDIKLTDDEIIYLKFAKLEGCNWIARDKNGYLYAYKEEPEKLDTVWSNDGDLSVNFNEIEKFKFIKWEDDEPYNIDELLSNVK